MFAVLAQEHDGLRRLGHPCRAHTQCSLDLALLDQLRALSLVAMGLHGLHRGHCPAVALRERDGKPPGRVNVRVRLHMVLALLEHGVAVPRFSCLHQPLDDRGDRGWPAGWWTGPAEGGVGRKETVSMSALSVGMHTVGTSARAPTMFDPAVAALRRQWYLGCNGSG
jgi:hypothetical protein